MARELHSRYRTPRERLVGVFDWVMLAEWSVDSEEFDHDLVHWVIRRDDLAARCFDRVRASADMV